MYAKTFHDFKHVVPVLQVSTTMNYVTGIKHLDAPMRHKIILNFPALLFLYLFKRECDYTISTKVATR